MCELKISYVGEPCGSHETCQMSSTCLVGVTCECPLGYNQYYDTAVNKTACMNNTFCPVDGQWTSTIAQRTAQLACTTNNVVGGMGDNNMSIINTQECNHVNVIPI